MMGHSRRQRRPFTAGLTVPDRSDQSLQLCFKHRNKHNDFERKDLRQASTMKIVQNLFFFHLILAYKYFYYCRLLFWHHFVKWFILNVENVHSKFVGNCTLTETV